MVLLLVFLGVLTQPQSESSWACPENLVLNLQVLANKLLN